MVNDWLLPILWAAAGAMGFGLIYRMRARKLILTFIGGALTWFAYLASFRAGINEGVCYALAAAIGTLYSELMARAIKTPVTAFVIPVNIPLVPGGHLFYSLVGLMENDTARFIDRGKYALGVAGAMALGIFVVTMLFKLIKPVKAVNKP